MHLIQLQHSLHGRRVGLIREPFVILLDPTVTSTYQFFLQVIALDKSVADSIERVLSTDQLEYGPIHASKSDWQMLPPIDWPDDPMKCMLSGTGLTHKASATNRQKMHEQEKVQSLTDSMKMYLWGEEGGKPKPNTIGVQPEWFYKGNGLNLKGHNDPLVVPNYADDGGDEPEVAGVYLISAKGIPHRLGFVQANEFSDHVMEKKNYLYLAPSKIRNCSIGPELVLDAQFDSIPGRVSILRGGYEYWGKEIRTGEEAITHSLENLEYHHFKYDQHRIPGQLHVHFFGAGAFSFGENIRLKQGDEMHVSFQNMGRPLINPVAIDTSVAEIYRVKTLK
ncbi:MAG TPA: AraD1 family protein [Chryseolinea sp.]|nr:AraD1 family protein [Chryseolinea sp.]